VFDVPEVSSFESCDSVVRERNVVMKVVNQSLSFISNGFFFCSDAVGGVRNC
jgi:hypothetical protein